MLHEPTPIQGELQAQVMTALWRLGGGTVDQVRGQLPPSRRRAYTTVQTVLNRLVERELVTRTRDGRRFVYLPEATEAQYLLSAIDRALAGASTGARQAALSRVIGRLDPTERSELERSLRTRRARRDATRKGLRSPPSRRGA